MERLEYIEKKRREGKALKWKCGILNELLWMCAGVDRDLIRSCKTDWTPKASIGGSILSTAILTVLFASIAIKMIADNLFITGIVSALFGIIVFYLDRYIVTSMYSDGKPSISIKELICGLPRIIIAFFLGLIIAIPIEIMIFRENISDYIQNNKIIAIANSREAIEIDKSIYTVQKEITDLDSCIQSYQEQYQREISSYNSPGYGFKAKSIEMSIQDSKERLFELHHVSDSLKKQKDRLISHASLTRESSLSQNIDALFEVTSYGKNKRLFFLNLFISLFFIILEITPILYKMMETYGVYDKLIEYERYYLDMFLKTKTIEESE